jgi:hypothetical protein
VLSTSPPADKQPLSFWTSTFRVGTWAVLVVAVVVIATVMLAARPPIAQRMTYFSAIQRPTLRRPETLVANKVSVANVLIRPAGAASGLSAPSSDATIVPGATYSGTGSVDLPTSGTAPTATVPQGRTPQRLSGPEPATLLATATAPQATTGPEMIALIHQYFAPAVWSQMEAIAQCESSLNPSTVSAPNRNGTRDWGLFQLNDGGTLQAQLSASGYPSTDFPQALDPEWNTQAAAALYSERGFSPWACAASLGIAESLGSNVPGPPTVQSLLNSGT